MRKNVQVQVSLGINPSFQNGFLHVAASRTASSLVSEESDSIRIERGCLMSTVKAYLLDGRKDFGAACTMEKLQGWLDLKWIEVLPVLIAVALAVLPNLNMDIMRSWGISQEVLLWPLLALVLFVLFRYARFTLLISVIALGIGANLPQQIGLQLGVDPTVLQLTLGLMVGLWLLNAVFQFLPAQITADVVRQVRTQETSAIMGAIYNGNVAEVDWLLKAGVSANLRNDQERTPLMLAVALGYQDIARLLMKYGADVTVRDARGETALSIATRREQEEMVSLLVALGAME